MFKSTCNLNYILNHKLYTNLHLWYLKLILLHEYINRLSNWYVQLFRNPHECAYMSFCIWDFTGKCRSNGLQLWKKRKRYLILSFYVLFCFLRMIQKLCSPRYCYGHNYSLHYNEFITRSVKSYHLNIELWVVSIKSTWFLYGIFMASSSSEARNNI